MTRPDDGKIVWIARRAEFVRDNSGRPVKMLGTVHDITEWKKAEERQSILNEELSHRLKNTLSLVQAIAAQTLRSATDMEAVRAFDKRIGALSRAHEVLLQTSWTSASLRTVLESVLQLHAEIGRVFIRGPEIKMGDKAALSLACWFMSLL